jgi:hypothetical protein
MHLLLSALLLSGGANPPYCRPNVFRPPAASPFGAGNRHEAGCRVYRVRAPRGTLLLAAATNQKDRERGLMDVRALPARVGMIFTFPGGDGMRVFWMKDTLIPLDMVFVRADGTVSEVAENVPATTHATPDAQIPRRFGVARSVIELNAGEAVRDGIIPGVRLALPELGAI